MFPRKLPTKGLTDELSIGAPSNDDLKELISDADGAKKSDDVAMPAKELDLLKMLEADFNEDEPTGPNIQQNLANIAMKRGRFPSLVKS